MILEKETNQPTKKALKKIQEKKRNIKWPSPFSN
jgi:hypothetical protein